MASLYGLEGLNRVGDTYLGVCVLNSYQSGNYLEHLL